MSAIFEALPGIEVPVGAISKSLAQIWTDTAADGRPAPQADDAKATQLNVVLHLGLNTTPDDAAQQFKVISAFSQRYPSRIVVLCPLHADVPAAEVRAKIYAECHFGKSKSDQRCVEFVMLSYSRSARTFLENQVSVCLSTDLPLYYWAHRFSASGRLADYRYLLGRAKRVLIDSAIAPPDALTYPVGESGGSARSRLLAPAAGAAEHRAISLGVCAGAVGRGIEIGGRRPRCRAGGRGPGHERVVATAPGGVRGGDGQDGFREHAVAGGRGSGAGRAFRVCDGGKILSLVRRCGGGLGDVRSGFGRGAHDTLRRRQPALAGKRVERGDVFLKKGRDATGRCASGSGRATDRFS
jgi:hypothetical protein